MSERCLCGNDKGEITVKTGFVTSGTGLPLLKDLSVASCPKCGLLRQVDLPFHTEDECLAYYENEYPPVGAEYSIKDYQKDLGLAKKRAKAYRLNKFGRLLDIGSGSGAFVDVCRGRGMDAFGCEIGKYHYSRAQEFTYPKRFEDIHFPTDHFDVVTSHDVVEHVLDPAGFLSEMFRAMAQGGQGYIEIPDFFHQSGGHHWKYAEHIWFFTLDQFRKMLSDAGFKVISVRKPVEAKVVFHVSKPDQTRPSILLPPGIGDSYWELVKLQAFLKREKLGLPDVFIACRRYNSYNSHNRAFPFLEMFPFVHSAGQTCSLEGKEYKQLWREAYHKCGQTIFKDVAGCDYFFSHNGYMGKGVPLDKVDPGLACNWDLPMFVSLQQEAFRRKSIDQYGKYIVFYFVFQGTYKYWLKEFPMTELIEYIKVLTAKTGFTPVIVGAAWDADHRVLRHLKVESGCVDLIGKTTLEEVFGLMRGAEMVVGFPSGLSIMSTVLGTKTLLIWNDYYNSQFVWNSCPPSTKNTTYFTENTKGLTVDGLVNKSLSVLGLPYKSILKVEGEALDNKSRTVVCVLRSGGDYTEDYVIRLRNSIARNATVPYEFVCLTDLDIDPSICKSIKLTEGWPGWWSKIELFRDDLTDNECLIYFDLDTVITGNIDELLSKKYSVAALRPWNKKNRLNGLFASGVMAWRNSGSYSFVFKQFDPSTIDQYKKGDQEYISNVLAEFGETPDFLQDIVPGIYSYKRNCHHRLPADARVVCFHGNPRPHELDKKWVKRSWR